MKTLFLIIALCTVPVFNTSCNAPASSRVIQNQTLKSVGELAETAVSVSAMLYRDGKISADQARQVMDFYDTRFQPAFRFAVSAAHSDLSSVSSADLALLAVQLSDLVHSFTSK